MVERTDWGVEKIFRKKGDAVEYVKKDSTHWELNIYVMEVL